MLSRSKTELSSKRAVNKATTAISDDLNAIQNSNKIPIKLWKILQRLLP